MKITTLNIKNVLGIAQVNVNLPTPVALFAGDNYAGKSSIREAIKAAFLGVSERVVKKKDFGQLVHDNGEDGSVAVLIEGGSAFFTAPDGKQELRHNFTMNQWEPMALALPYCLDIEAFADANAESRRTLLFALTGASAKGSDIAASLKDKGLSDKLIETVTPLLRSGFPAAADFATNKARDAKSDWKAITKETYGHVKAESWAASVPEVDTTAIEQLRNHAEILKGKITTEQTKLGAAEQKLKAWLTHSENREADQATANKLASLEKKLDHDQDELTTWGDKVAVLEQQAGTGPRVGLVHDLAACLAQTYEAIYTSTPDLAAQIDLALEPYEKQYGAIDAKSDPEAAAKVPKAIEARDLMQRCVNNTKRDIDTAKAAQARLTQTVEKGSEAEVESIETILQGYRQELSQVVIELNKLQAAQSAAAVAQEATSKAKVHHEAVKQWQIAIDALSADGIPAEILRRALGPINRLLAEKSTALGWGQVRIDGDMMITSNSRPHALLSESEKWRTNAIIALVIAQTSGLKLAAFDRFDVLSVSGRADFIDAIDVMAENGTIDTALIFGTFKKLPDLKQFPQVSGYWVESGAIAGQAQALKEAA